jgi:hypothetical protein
MSGTEGKSLPADAIKVQYPLPIDNDKYTKGTTVNAKTDVAVGSTYLDTTSDGTWTFEGWTPASHLIANADVVFVGAWTFEANTYGATYGFAASGTDQALPSALNAYLPTDNRTFINNEPVVPVAITPAPYTDSDNDGTRTFVSWDAASKTGNGADVHFTGTWTFASNLHNVTYSFVSTAPTTYPLASAINGYLPTHDKQVVKGEPVNPKAPPKQAIATRTSTAPGPLRMGSTSQITGTGDVFLCWAAGNLFPHSTRQPIAMKLHRQPRAACRPLPIWHPRKPNTRTARTVTPATRLTPATRCGQRRHLDL